MDYFAFECASAELQADLEVVQAAFKQVQHRLLCNAAIFMGFVLVTKVGFDCYLCIACFLHGLLFVLVTTVGFNWFDCHMALATGAAVCAVRTLILALSAAVRAAAAIEPPPQVAGFPSEGGGGSSPLIASGAGRAAGRAVT